KPISRPLISYGVLGISLLAEGASWVISLRTLRRGQPGHGIWAAARRSKDASVFAVLFEDSAAMVGIGIAAGAIRLSQATGQACWDGVGSVLIAALLACAGLMLACECHGLLTGESAVPELRRD